MMSFDYQEKMPSNATVDFLGDLHVGSEECDEDALRRYVKSIKGKRSQFVAFGGDQLETIHVGDKRFSMESHGRKATIYKQKLALVDILSPISRQILWMLDGNHEQTIRYIDPATQDVCDRLGVPFGTYMATAQLTPEVKVLDYHGFGRSPNILAGDPQQRRLNYDLAVKRRLIRLGFGDTNVKIHHHYHNMSISAPTTDQLQLYTEGGEIKSTYKTPFSFEKDGIRMYPDESCWYGCSGSFLRNHAEGYSPYAEVFGLSPTELGFLRLTIKNDVVSDLKKVVV